MSQRAAQLPENCAKGGTDGANALTTHEDNGRSDGADHTVRGKESLGDPTVHESCVTAGGDGNEGHLREDSVVFRSPRKSHQLQLRILILMTCIRVLMRL